MHPTGPTSTPRAWRYVEPCCGSAAIALALAGARRPLLPYQGSKWRFRARLLQRFVRLGFHGAPTAIHLTDAGPWGRVAPQVFDPERRARTLQHLRSMAQADPRELYDALNHHPTPPDDARFAAEFLFLQRLAYSGKAVGERDERWSSPGFNSSSAYGLPATTRFGSVNPMVPSLVRVLEGYATLKPIPVDGAQRPAQPPQGAAPDTLVYLDPPYRGSTAYPCGALDRDEVAALALAWRDAGATVVISEGEPIDALLRHGWQAERLDAGRGDTSRFRGKQPEWLTISPPS